MADQPNEERDEPQRTIAHEDRVRGVGDRDDVEFEDDEDLDEEADDAHDRND